MDNGRPPVVPQCLQRAPYSSHQSFEALQDLEWETASLIPHHTSPNSPFCTPRGDQEVIPVTAGLPQCSHRLHTRTTLNYLASAVLTHYILRCITDAKGTGLAGRMGPCSVLVKHSANLCTENLPSSVY
jgi:hypothetical protein